MSDVTGYAFAPKLAPIAKPEDNLVLIPDKKPFKVQKVEGLPTLILDFGSLTARTKDTKVKDLVENRLEMPELQLAQLRMSLLDDFEIEFRQPKATTKWTTVHKTFILNKHLEQIPDISNLTEWFQFEDRSAGIIRFNPTETDLNKTRILFYGFKYFLKPLAKIPAKYTAVPVGEL